MVWSDECYIHLDDKMGRIFVTRRVDEELDEDCIVPTFKQSPVHIMVWGCVALGWKGPLAVLEYPGGKGRGMTAARYQERVLEGQFKVFWKDLEEAQPGLAFQQDGAPSHTAKTTKCWLARNDIPLFPHPPNSPDLNPIEPIWHELKKRLRALPRHPTSTKALREVVLQEWALMPLKDIDKHIETILD